MDACVGFRQSRLDSSRRNGEEDVAVRPVRFDSRGEEPNVGGGSALTAAMEKLGEEKKSPDPEIPGRNGGRGVREAGERWWGRLLVLQGDRKSVV